MSELVRNVRLWFGPQRIREEGDTPDYRFSLANERTFLAWLRTALALLGAGVLCSLRAVNHWVRCERAMRRGEDLPVSRFPALLSVVIAVVAVAMVVVVLVGWEA